MISKETFKSFNNGVFVKDEILTNVIVVEDFMDNRMCFVSWLSDERLTKNYYILVETQNNPSKQINKMCEKKYRTFSYTLESNNNERLNDFLIKSKWIKNDFYITIFHVWFYKIVNGMKTNLKNIVRTVKDSIRYNP